MPRLIISLLGGFQVTLNEKPIQKFYSKKSQALLAYLAVEAYQVHERVRLASLLWPDIAETYALQNLRQALSRLRRTLKESDATSPFLQVSRTHIQVNPKSDYQIDVVDFLTLLDQATPNWGQLDQAMTLYQGALLHGFTLPDSQLFTDWFLSKRAMYQQMALSALHTLTEHALTTQLDYETAVRHARRQLTIDNLQEVAHRQLMQALVGLGQRSVAIAQYEACRQILDENLGVAPASETTALYEAILSGAFMPAPKLTTPVPRHNMPSTITPCLGRETELAQLLTLFSKANTRLVTLVGPGGIGKTRLSLEFGHQLILPKVHPADSVFFVPLTAVENTTHLATTIATSLKIPLSGSEPTERSVFNYLYNKHLLLILDNLEHLPDAPDFVTQLLQQTHQLQLLATSRSRLNIPGEQVMELQGLAFPEKKAPSSPPSQTFAAMNLFALAAHQVNIGFKLTPENSSIIAQICQLVNGLPLGIELAAAWTRILSPIEIKAGIEQDLDFLAHSQRRPLQRHMSLRAVFSYSWSLLTEQAQQTLLRLAIFRGGFNRQAASQVANAPLTILANLLDHSWLQRTASPHGRFEILDILRRFIADKLAKRQQVEYDTQRKHATYFASFLQTKTTELQGGDQKQALADIGIEIENIRIAWVWAVQNSHWEIIGMALEGLFHFYDTQSWFREGKRQFEYALSTLPPPTDELGHITHAKLLARLGWFTFHHGQIDQSLMLLTQSLNQFKQQQDHKSHIFNLNYLGAIKRHQGEQTQNPAYYREARQYLDEGLQLAQQVGDHLNASIALNILGQISSLEGDYVNAKALCEQGLALKRQIGDQWGMTFSLTYLGRVAQALGNHQEAHTLLRESMEISREFDDRRGVAFALYNLGDVAQALNQKAEAQALYSESLQIFREIGNQQGERQVLAKLSTAS